MTAQDRRYHVVIASLNRDFGSKYGWTLRKTKGKEEWEASGSGNLVLWSDGQWDMTWWQRKIFLAEMSWCVQFQTEAPGLICHFINNLPKPCFHSEILSATFLIFHLVFLKRNSTKLIMWYAEDLQFPEKHLAMPGYTYLSMLGDSYVSEDTVTCVLSMCSCPPILCFLSRLWFLC